MRTFDAHSEGLRVLTAEVHGVAGAEVLRFERRDGDDPRPEVVEGEPQPREVRAAGQDREVGVAARRYHSAHSGRRGPSLKP
jgi:hypothetical protein